MRTGTIAAALILSAAACPGTASAAVCAGTTAEAVEACIDSVKEGGVAAVDAMLKESGFSRTAEMEPHTAHFYREARFLRGPAVMAVLVTDGDRVVRVAVR